MGNKYIQIDIKMVDADKGLEQIICNSMVKLDVGYGENATLDTNYHFDIKTSLIRQIHHVFMLVVTSLDLALF